MYKHIHDKHLCAAEQVTILYCTCMPQALQGGKTRGGVPLLCQSWWHMHLAGVAVGVGQRLRCLCTCCLHCTCTACVDTTAAIRRQATPQWVTPNLMLQQWHHLQPSTHPPTAGTAKEHRPCQVHVPDIRWLYLPCQQLLFVPAKVVDATGLVARSQTLTVLSSLQVANI
jgi:hypothetical protein